MACPSGVFRSTSIYTWYGVRDRSSPTNSITSSSSGACLAHCCSAFVIWMRSSIVNIEILASFSDEVGSSPEIEIWESLPEVRHKRLDILATATGLMQRILQEHVGSGEFIDYAEG